MIRIAGVAAVAAFVVFAGTPPGHAETWCLRQIDGGAHTCVFSSGEDCSRAARMSASGGICEREGSAASDAGRQRGSRSRAAPR